MCLTMRGLSPWLEDFPPSRLKPRPAEDLSSSTVKASSGPTFTREIFQHPELQWQNITIAQEKLLLLTIGAKLTCFKLTMAKTATARVVYKVNACV